MLEGVQPLPILDFLTEFDPEDSESRFLAAAKLNAVMLYPSNQQLREELITFRTVEWEQIKAARKEGKPVAAICDDSRINLWLSQLVHMQRRHILPEIRRLTHGGILAGRRLYMVAGLETHGAGGSFNHSDELIPYKKLHDKEKIISTAKGAIHPAWKEFQGVSHLWAAEEILRLLHPHAENVPESCPEKLIPIAEWFRQFGEHFRPENTKKPVLDSEVTWRPPLDFDLIPFDGEEFLIQDKFRDFTPGMLAKL